MDLRLYAVTDKGQNERCGRSNAEVIEAAIRGGATFIQLREKDAPGGRHAGGSPGLPRGVPKAWGGSRSTPSPLTFSATTSFSGAQS